MTSSLFQIYTANFPDQVPQSVFSVGHPSEYHRCVSKDQHMKKHGPHLLGIHNCSIEFGAELGNIRVLFSSQQYEHRHEKLPAQCNARGK